MEHRILCVLRSITVTTMCIKHYYYLHYGITCCYYHQYHIKHYHHRQYTCCVLLLLLYRIGHYYYRYYNTCIINIITIVNMCVIHYCRQYHTSSSIYMSHISYHILLLSPLQHHALLLQPVSYRALLLSSSSPPL